MRMVWDRDGRNHSEPRYELRKYRRPQSRRFTMVSLCADRHGRVAYHVWARRSFAGRLGEWPVYRYGVRKKASQS
jgi:hypothetical protein